MSTVQPNPTRESYLAAARDVIMTRYAESQRHNPEVINRLRDVKVVYGVGQPNLRGTCYFNGWHGSNGTGETPLIEVTAFGEQDRWQLAGTLLHELSHAAAGWKAGHGKDWRQWCETFGLRLPRAVGHVYMPSGFDGDLRDSLLHLNDPADGKPNLRAGLGGQWKPRRAPPCPVSIGVRGGKSRGTGSGSSLRLYVCECTPPVKVRVSSDAFAAHCDHCAQSFSQPG